MMFGSYIKIQASVFCLTGGLDGILKWSQKVLRGKQYCNICYSVCNCACCCAESNMEITEIKVQVETVNLSNPITKFRPGLG